MVADPMASFGVLWRRHRLGDGLTKVRLATRHGQSLRRVSDQERGARRAPYPATIRRLADALAFAALEDALPSYHSFAVLSKGFLLCRAIFPLQLKTHSQHLRPPPDPLCRAVENA